MRYLHEDGILTSFAYASDIIQNLLNNEIRNATQIVTLTPGFVGDGFRPYLKGKSPSDPSVFIVAMKAGAAVFPSGEVFAGNSFECSVPISKSDGFQYLKLVYQPLKRTKQTMAYGSTDEYAEIIDGARVVLTTGPTAANLANELFIAKIQYPTAAKIPIITDIRDFWKYYWTGSQVLDMGITPTVSCSHLLSLSLVQSSLAINASVMNTEFSLLQANNLGPSPIGINHWDHRTRSEKSDFVNVERKVAPHLSLGSALQDREMVRIPPGLDLVHGQRMADAYRPEFITEWAEIDVAPFSDLPDINHLTLDLKKYDNVPMMAVRAYISDAVDDGNIIQLWVVPSQDPGPGDRKADIEIPLVYREAIPLTAMPYILFNYPQAMAALKVFYRIVTPGQRPTAIGTQNLTSGVGVGSAEEIIDIPIGHFEGTKMFVNTRFKFYVPVSAANDTGVPRTRTISKTEFFNYLRQDTLGDEILVEFGGTPAAWEVIHDGAGDIYLSANNGGSGAGPTWPDKPVAMDIIYVLHSDNSSEFPNGRYEVTGTTDAGGIAYIHIKPLYQSIIFSAGPGVCCEGIKVFQDSASLPMTPVLYDITDPSDPILTFDYSAGIVVPITFGGEPYNPLAGCGEIGAVDAVDRNVCFAANPFHTVDNRSIQVTEGHWYEFRMGDSSGYLCDVLGHIKLTLL